MSVHSTLHGGFDRELELAGKLAREAGRLAMQYRDGELEVELKPGDEPVTIADRAASEHIVRELTAAFPDDVVISEENADDLRRLDAERVWYIDPIDGTKDFIRGHAGFSVMIGLAVGHRPAAGVVFQPVGDRMFAGTGEGAWMVTGGASADPVPMRVSDVDDVAAIRFVASRSHRAAKLDRVKGALGITNELNIGSVGLKLSLIAAGDRDLYVNPSSRCKSWDTCAPEVILAGAGGMLTDVHGEPLRYDERDVRRRRGLVASNGRVHAAVIARLASVFPSHQPPEA